MHHFLNIFIAPLIFTLGLASATTVRAQDNGQTALIAVIGPMNLARGQSIRDAAQFAVSQINQQGLRIDGKNLMLKLLIVDDKNDTHLAAISARAAVAAGVVGVIGHFTTDTSVAAAPIYEAAGIPMLSPTAAGRELVQNGYRYVFQMLGHSGYTGKYLARESIRLAHARRIMVIDSDTLFAADLSKAFIQTARLLGAEIVETDRINFNTSNFNDTIGKIKRSNPDTILFTGVMPQSSAFAARLQQVGVQSRLLIAGGAINTKFPVQTESYPENTLLLVAGYPIESAPDFLRLKKKYQEKYTSTLFPLSWSTYDAVSLLVAAMKRTNSIDPHRLAPTLHLLKLKGLSGTISFAADGSLNNPPYTLYRAEHGSWKTDHSLP